MVLEAANLGIPAALVGSVASQLATYSPLPNRMIVSSDGVEVANFFNSQFTQADETGVPDLSQLRIIMNKILEG